MPVSKEAYQPWTAELRALGFALRTISQRLSGTLQMPYGMGMGPVQGAVHLWLVAVSISQNTTSSIHNS